MAGSGRPGSAAWVSEGWEFRPTNLQDVPAVHKARPPTDSSRPLQTQKVKQPCLRLSWDTVTPIKVLGLSPQEVHMKHGPNTSKGTHNPGSAARTDPHMTT